MIKIQILLGHIHDDGQLLKYTESVVIHVFVGITMTSPYGHVQNSKFVHHVLERMLIFYSLFFIV